MKTISRRRMVTMIAGVAGAALLPGGRPAHGESVARWHGVAMGARASLTLVHEDKDTAAQALRSVRSEIRRLERIFSLFDVRSTVSQLNRNGAVENPPLDFINCLGQALQFSGMTGGAFDPTVQPLWELYAGHFKSPDADPDGPPPADVNRALIAVDYRNVAISSGHVRFKMPHMGITLNGIAQGYITDRVRDMLRGFGFSNVLIDLGEPMALGWRPGGGAWRIGLTHGVEKTVPRRYLEISNGAVATSCGAGTQFTTDGTFHHLFDPRYGAPANRHRAMTVSAPDATTADALSTAFFFMADEKIRAVIRNNTLKAEYFSA